MVKNIHLKIGATVKLKQKQKKKYFHVSLIENWLYAEGKSFFLILEALIKQNELKIPRKLK